MRGRHKTFNRGHLLARLRKGPLDSSDWACVSSSQKSLHVRISMLRVLGYEVESVSHEKVIIGAGRPRVDYVLKSEPRCSLCGR